MPRRPKHPGLSTSVVDNRGRHASITSDVIRVRLREALTHKRISQVALTRRLAARTGRLWPPNRVSKLLTRGRHDIILRVEDLLLICEVTGIAIAALVREPGRTLVDLTADEVEMVQLLRGDPALAAHIRTLLLKREKTESTESTASTPAKNIA